MGLYKTRRYSRILSSCILLAMLAAFAVKAVLPAGFMPGVNKDGMVALVICSGMGEKTVFVPQDGAPEAPQHSGDQKADPCAYHLASSHKGITPVIAAISVPTLVVVQESFRVQAKALSSRLAAATSARGPPSSV